MPGEEYLKLTLAATLLPFVEADVSFFEPSNLLWI